MLEHISKTKTLQRFLGASGDLPDSGTIRFIRKEHPDWKERLITPRQFWYIRLLAQQNCISIEHLNNRCFRQFGADLSTMKRTDASSVIQDLKRSLNEQYKPFH
ncbi:hypothetical protein [Desulfobacter postgatei]|uniref:Uncharacterized protein n=1 Tax=Desulfobacter postgatei 2ac9 TaxID=879212 RepID=I5AZP2_9BACT|nr:hypothetical protein [Desulfobacter postgatei]EIM62705.1 hypothetical protein DespoDRAFT_00711 [Desulfobacter postgatei 2ac9]